MAQYMSTTEAANWLGVTVDYFYSLLWSKKVEARKVDGKWQVSVASLHKRRGEIEKLRALIAGNKAERENNKQ